MTKPSDVVIREALPADASILSDIARRAKASHGYPREWLAEWEEELTLRSTFIEANPVFVCEAVPMSGDAEGADASPRAARPHLRSRTTVGFVALENGADGPEIAHLWVLPEAHGRGIGRALVQRVIQEARSRGWRAVRILSDPNSTGFYERMGAVCVGTHPAPVAGKPRELPVLRLSIEQP